MQHLHSSDLMLILIRTVTIPECDPAVGMKNFFDMLSRKTHKVIVLFGAACTAVTDPIAKAAQFFKLVQITYADTHPMYRMENYPNLFRVVPSEAAFNPARVALLQYFNWTRVGTLYQNSPRYALPHSKLLTALETAKIDIAAQHGFVDELTSAIHKLKETDVRIILGNFDQSWAGQIFCEAYRVGLYGRKYQWIIVGMYDDYWWKKTGNNTTCDKYELQEALEGYIATDILPLSTDDKITVSGLVPSEYEAQYNKGRRMNYSRFHGYAYDGIWAIALAMQKVRQKLMSEKSAKSLEMFEYKDPMWVRLFREALNKTSFLGVTGPVSFIRNERRGLILLKQFQGGTEMKIGEYDSIANSLDLSKGTTIKWRGDTDPPMDRTLIVIERTRISVTVYSLLVTFSILGILLASVFLVVNIRYRNQRNIKMSSPYLNNLIIVGCMLTYTSVILLGMDSGLTSEQNFPYICAGRAWVLMSGFTLAFGSMFSKTWRVHAIFTDIKLNKKAIKDYKLFMVVGVLMMIDVAILTTWQIIDPFYRRTSLGPPMPSTKKKDVVIIPEMEFCQSEKMTVFLGSTYAYKGLLMAFGCFLAWETRHVSIPALNDSKYVGMSVYNVVIMCVIGAAISFVLRDKQDAAFVIISVFIIFCSTTTLCLVFVPKLVELRRNTDNGDIRARATLKPFKSSRRNSDDEIHNKIKSLENQNCRQKQILNEKSIELQTLVLELKEMEEPLVMIKHAITTISENSSSSADSTCENLSKVVSSYIIKEEEPFSKTSHPSEEDFSQRSLLWKSKETTGTDVEHTKQRCAHQNESISALAPLTPEVKKIRFKENSLTTTIEMHPLSITEKISQTIKYMDSESESSSESSSLQKNASLKDRDVRIESDDTSYTRAIRSFHQRVIVNGMSSSCDEDVEESGSRISQKGQDSSSLNRKNNREKAKSLGTLHLLTTTNNEGPCDPCVPVIHTRRTDGGAIPPLFPYLNRTVNDDQALTKYPSRDHTAPMYSSFPSVKCDIVEYL